jgi:hypothetical protein
MSNSLLSDIKKGVNNDNLSSISKYFKKNSYIKNENINNEITENIITENTNNEYNFIDKENKLEEVKLINEEIKQMLEQVIEFKTNAYNKLKSNKIGEALKDYFSVK